MAAAANLQEIGLVALGLSLDERPRLGMKVCRSPSIELRPVRAAEAQP